MQREYNTIQHEYKGDLGSKNRGTSTFMSSMLKTVYRRSSPDVFSKKRRSAAGMLHIYRRIPIQKCDFSRAQLTLLHGCSPVNWLNVEHLSRKTPLGD